MTAEIFPGSGLFSRGASAFAASVPVDPADDGFFGPGSVTWRLHADLSAPVSGLRSLLLQALHPLAMAGVDQHSQWRDDPAGRFASTAAYVLTTTYGDRATARAAADRVRKIHEWVRGTDPVTGRPYAAGDPDLLIWVHAAQVESGLTAARLYGASLQRHRGRPLRGRDDRLGRAGRGAARRGRPRRWPSSTTTSTAVRPELTLSPAAADTAAYLTEMPAIEPELTDLWQVLAAASVASLPDWAKDLYGRADTVAPDRTEVRQVLGVLDALYLGEPGVLEARQRLTLRMRAGGQ